MQTPGLTTPKYPQDKIALMTLLPERRLEFEKFMAALDAESASRGHPYGEGSLWQTTGAECWLSYFNDGYSPSGAMAEDLSYD